MQDLLEKIKEIVVESRQFGKSRLLREYLDEIEKLVDVELAIIERQQEQSNGNDD